MKNTLKTRLIRGFVFLVILLLGVAGNYFNISLFYGVNFIFGSIATLVIITLYGPLPGILSAAIISAYTYFLWHHPYALIIFIAEAVFISLLTRSRVKNLVLADALFWLCGMPMIWFFYSWVLNMNQQAVLLITLKQSMNGIHNAFAAMAILSIVPFFRSSGYFREVFKNSLQHVLFLLLLSLVFISSLSIMVIQNRNELKNIEYEICQQLKYESDKIKTSVRNFLSHNFDVIAVQTRMIPPGNIIPSREFQIHIQAAVEMNPSFHNIYIADASGTTVAFFPPVNEHGESTIGINFSDRPYYKEVKTTLKPYISDVFIARGGVFVPIVVIVLPIVDKNLFKGYALGALNLSKLKNFIQVPDTPSHISVTILSGSDRIIASTDISLKTLDPFRQYHADQLTQVENGIFHYLPETKQLPSMERWKSSRYIKMDRISDLVPWTSLVEISAEPFRNKLYRMHIENLFVMLCLTIFAIIISSIISRKMGNNLNKLAEATSNLPSKLLQHNEIHLPRSSIAEIQDLSSNFLVMADTLSMESLEKTEIIREMGEAKKALENRTRDLEKAYNEIKTIQIQIIQQEKMASIGQLAAGIAHEINNPASFIMSNLEVLLQYSASLKEFIIIQSNAIDNMLLMAEGESVPRSKIVSAEVQSARSQLNIDHIDADMPDLVSESLSGVERIRRIVQDLKSFSRIDEMEWNLVDINEGIESILNIIHNEMKYKVDLDLKLGELPKTYCNIGQLNQVFLNLLMNALHAIEASRGHIGIQTWYGEGDIHINITDDGAGIPESLQSRIFEPFFTTKEVGKGTGLGLSISFEIVKKHNGRIEFKSEQGKGTIFTVIIPVLPELGSHSSGLADP